MSVFILTFFVALFVYNLHKTPKKSETGETGKKRKRGKKGKNRKNPKKNKKGKKRKKNKKGETPETGETPKPCETPETGETYVSLEKDTLPDIALAKGLSLNELHCRINDLQNIISKIKSEILQISKQDQDHASKKMVLNLKLEIIKMESNNLYAKLYQ